MLYFNTLFRVLINMSEQTFIIGKDASLEESIARMQKTLLDGGFEIEEVSWLNPVTNVYSVHIKDKYCPALFTNGKGSTKKACLASAYGEFLERLETNYFFSDFKIDFAEQKFIYYPNEVAITQENFKSVLNEKLWALYDPNNEFEAEDLLSFNDDSELISCIPMQAASDNTTVLFPMNVFSNLYASNGLCAGNTLEEAKVQGLSEIFERWVKATILKENLCLPEVPAEVLSQFPVIVAAIKDLNEHGLEVSVRDASLGGKYPVMNVTLFEQSSGQCFASFGAHPIFEVALERTLTESLQGRKLGSLEGFQTPVFDVDIVADDENIENHFIDSSGLIHAKFISDQYDFEFVNWNFSGDTKAQYQALVKIVHELELEVYTADYEHYGLPASRMVVPGMSEVFPIAEMLENNQNQGRVLRNILNDLEADFLAEEKLQNSFQIALDEIAMLGLSDHQGVANLIGLLPSANSYWKKLKIVELNMFLTLGMGDLEETYELLQDCFYFVDDKEMLLFYKALSFYLDIKLADSDNSYNPAMIDVLFGKNIHKKVLDHINGISFMNDLPIGKEAFAISRLHQRLLNVYKRVHAVKQS